MPKKNKIWEEDTSKTEIPENIILEPYEPYIEEIPQKQIFEEKQKATVIAINPERGFITLEDKNGNGIRIKYEKELHELLAIGDELEI